MNHSYLKNIRRPSFSIGRVKSGFGFVSYAIPCTSYELARCVLCTAREAVLQYLIRRELPTPRHIGGIGWRLERLTTDCTPSGFVVFLHTLLHSFRRGICLQNSQFMISFALLRNYKPLAMDETLRTVFRKEKPPSAENEAWSALKANIVLLFLRIGLSLPNCHGGLFFFDSVDCSSYNAK
jgi:hypothetical protein